MEKKNNSIFKKIKQLQNDKKFKIIELTSKEKLSITQLSKMVDIAFNKCSNYCTELEKENLIIKEKSGKYTKIKSNVKIGDGRLIFSD